MDRQSLLAASLVLRGGPTRWIACRTPGLPRGAGAVTRRALAVVLALAATVELAACECGDGGAVVTYAGTDALAPVQGIWAVEYLVAGTPAPGCAQVLAALEAGAPPPGTVVRQTFQLLAPDLVRNDFRLLPAPSRRNGCPAGSATGTFAALLYDAAEPPCVGVGCPAPPPLLATACAEGVTIHADRKTRLDLPIQAVP
jgi:hypothetical protein